MVKALLASFSATDVDMSLNFPVSAEHGERHARIIREWLTVQRHYDFFMWLQSDMQHYLPHEIMLAGWGDFKTGRIRHDIVSALIDVRTERSSAATLSPLLQGVFNRWSEHGKTPCTLHAGECGFLLEGRGLQCPLGSALQGMKSVLIHGVSDKRWRHDCLYLLFSSKREIRASSLMAMKVLLPYLDTAFGRLQPPPRRRTMASVAANRADHGLNAQEIEIMNWTRAGKTVPEIAVLLKTGVFTVTNGLGSLLRKLDTRLPIASSVRPRQSDRVPKGN